jgi:hypothetical protein
MLVNNSNILLLVIEIRVVNNAFEILIEIKDLKGNNE